MRLNYNMMSMNIFRNYNETTKTNSKTLSKISSGSKIMSAKDNPNKIGQSENFKLQIRSLQAAQKNIQDGASMMQTFDEALGGISESLIRMRELVIQAGSESNSLEDLKSIQDEIEQIKNGIDDLAQNTEFNGVKLLNGSSDSSTIRMVSGSNVGETISIPIFNFNTNYLVDKSGSHSVAEIDITKGRVDLEIATIDEAMKTINDGRGKYGALENRFTNLNSNYEDVNLMLGRAQGIIEDTDIAKEMVEFSRTNILIEAANYMMAQSNNLPNDALRVLERI